MLIYFFMLHPLHLVENLAVPLFYPLYQTHPSTKASGIGFCYISIGTSATKILPHQKWKQPKPRIVAVTHSAFQIQIFRATYAYFVTVCNVSIIIPFPRFPIQNIKIGKVNVAETKQHSFFSLGTENVVKRVISDFLLIENEFTRIRATCIYSEKKNNENSSSYRFFSNLACIGSSGASSANLTRFISSKLDNTISYYIQHVLLNYLLKLQIMALCFVIS